MQFKHRLSNNDELTMEVSTTEEIESFIRYCNELDVYLKNVFGEPAEKTAAQPANSGSKQSNRGEPATQKQIDCLKRHRIAFSDGITKGEAYDLLNGVIGDARR